MIFPKRLLLSAIAQLFLLETGCTAKSEITRNTCLAAKHDIFLYATNWSRVDTLARVLIVVDDSTIINKITSRNQLSSEKLEKVIRVCEGPHNLHVEFGRYSQDTTIIVNHKISLLSSMVYEEKYTGDNGLGIAILRRVD
jgi:hypothetical protein